MSDKQKSAGSRRSKPLDPLTLAPVGQVLSELGVAADAWDALIVGDGSGTSWKQGCGWASVLVDHYSNMRHYFKGAMDPGTVNVAELAAYFHALLWYSNGPGKARLNDLLGRNAANRVRVHVVTDSEVIANQGNGTVGRKVNEPLWAAVDCITRHGYHVTWHWVPRDKLGLNRLVDHLSREARKAVEAVAPPEGVSIYDFNPSEA